MERLLTCVACLVVTASALAGANYTNGSSVNLLDRWNPDGTYGYALTSSGPDWDSPTKLCPFNTAEFGWRNGWAMPASGQTATAWAEWDFGAPTQIGSLRLVFREANHSPLSWRFLDENGNELLNVTDNPHPAAGIYNWTLPATATVTKLRYEVTNANDGVQVAFQTLGIGAYAPAGQPVAIDGKTDIFYEETEASGRMVRTGGQASWTDPTYVGNGVKPGAVTTVDYTFSQKYHLDGAFLSHYDANRLQQIVKIETSLDGTTYSEVYSVNDWKYRNMPAPNNLGYMVFNSPANDPARNAKYVRLTIDNSTNTSPVEIVGFKLFGTPILKVPGDANNDSKVDFADYLILESSYGSAPGGPDSDADFDDNNVVEFADYLVLEANFGTGAVPEPMTLTLLGLGGLALIRRR